MVDLKTFRTFIPVDSLSMQNIGDLAKMANVVTLKKGQQVITLGDTDPDFVYLQSGEIELVGENLKATRMSADSDQSLYPLANLKPRQFTVTVTSKQASFIRIDGPTLEKMLAWTHVSLSEESGMEVEEIGDMSTMVVGGNCSWMLSLLQTRAFLKLPPANIKLLLESFEPVEVEANETIIKMGEPGDFYYLIQKGECTVSRGAGSKHISLAKLGPGDCFGEDALVSDEPRNATVTMTTDGMLHRLDKARFSTLLKEPLINWVTIPEAKELARAGAFRIDLRTEKEFKNSGLKGCTNIPLFMLRLKAAHFSTKRKYLLLCDTGARSAAGAFIMTGMGFDAYPLKGGLTSVAARTQQE